MPAASAVILGIESSCDETAAAVVRGGSEVLSNVIATQHDLHEKYAGVVPELASRAHLERIVPVIRDALAEAGLSYEDIDGVAVGHRPGLIGSLLVGVAAAKALAWSLNKPLIGIDHIHAHLYACRLDAPPINWPAIGLVVSGGHSSLFYLQSPLELHCIGRTIDDAVGEAFDKAATILGLGYPGGPHIDALAQDGDDRAVDFPVANLGRDEQGRPSLDFSFSGLKTSLLYTVRGRPTVEDNRTVFERDADALTGKEKADLAASFQRAAIRPLVRNLKRALDRHPDCTTVLTGGGVTANTRLRTELQALGELRTLDLRLPQMQYCLDNAAMIAGLACEFFTAGRCDDLSLSASPSTAFLD